MYYRFCIFHLLVHRWAGGRRPHSKWQFELLGKRNVFSFWIHKYTCSWCCLTHKHTDGESVYERVDEWHHSHSPSAMGPHIQATAKGTLYWGVYWAHQPTTIFCRFADHLFEIKWKWRQPASDHIVRRSGTRWPEVHDPPFLYGPERMDDELAESEIPPNGERMSVRPSPSKIHHGLYLPLWKYMCVLIDVHVYVVKYFNVCIRMSNNWT